MRRYHKISFMEMKNGSASNAYYSKEEICVMLRISMSTLNRRIAAGDLSITRVGGKVLVSQENLELFLNGNYQ